MQKNEKYNKKIKKKKKKKKIRRAYSIKTWLPTFLGGDCQALQPRRAYSIKNKD